MLKVKNNKGARILGTTGSLHILSFLQKKLQAAQMPTDLRGWCGLQLWSAGKMRGRIFTAWETHVNLAPGWLKTCLKEKPHPLCLILLLGGGCFALKMPERQDSLRVPKQSAHPTYMVLKWTAPLWSTGSPYFREAELPSALSGPQEQEICVWQGEMSLLQGKVGCCGYLELTWLDPAFSNRETT